VLPARRDDALGYEYLPEEEVPAETFKMLFDRIDATGAREEVDPRHLQCAAEVCPI
jgi:hypothetical protein